MTETKWTPGPWVADCTKVEGDSTGNRHDIAFCAMPLGLKPREESLANAHLIAAAPDLYAALEKAQSELEGVERFVVRELGDATEMETVLRPIRAALARARGEAK